MAVLNSVTLIGRLCADPKLEYTSGGDAKCTFRLAVERAYANSEGERQADFINIVAWRKTGEFVEKHFSKGKLIGVEGELQSRSWETDDGQKRSVVEVKANNVSFVGPKQNGDSEGAEPESSARPRGRSSRKDDEDDYNFS